MTNQKICDKCKAVILKGSDYCKLQWIRHEGKRQIYEGAGHLCGECMTALTGGHYD